MKPSVYALYADDAVRNAPLSCRRRWNVAGGKAGLRSSRPRRHRPFTAPTADGFGDMRAEDIGAAGEVWRWCAPPAGCGAWNAPKGVAFLPYVQIRRKSLIQKAWGFEPKTLGDHIRRRRLMLSITQEEAAHRLGVNAWTVHNWETGETKPVIQFIPALVRSLGYDPEQVDTGMLAGQLVAKRRELGLSQRVAARSLGIDPGTWAGWELGARIAREAHRRAMEGFLENPGTASQLAQGRGR